MGFGHATAFFAAVNGLTAAADNLSNILAMFAAPVPSAEQNPAFLNLVNVIFSSNAQPVPAADVPAPAKTTAGQVADALIRSMLATQPAPPVVPASGAVIPPASAPAKTAAEIQAAAGPVAIATPASVAMDKVSATNTAVKRSPAEAFKSAAPAAREKRESAVECSAATATVADGSALNLPAIAVPKEIADQIQPNAPMINAIDRTEAAMPGADAKGPSDAAKSVKLPGAIAADLTSTFAGPGGGRGAKPVIASGAVPRDHKAERGMKRIEQTVNVDQTFNVDEREMPKPASSQIPALKRQPEKSVVTDVPAIIDASHVGVAATPIGSMMKPEGSTISSGRGSVEPAAGEVLDDVREIPQPVSNVAFAVKLTPVEMAPEIAVPAQTENPERRIQADDSPVQRKQLWTSPVDIDDDAPAVRAKTDSHSNDFSDQPKDRREEAAHAVAGGIVSATPSTTGAIESPATHMTAPVVAAPRIEAPFRAVAESIRASDSLTDTPAAIPHTATAQSIALRVAGGDATPVELHVTERAGEIHVAVRTTDRGLETSLRQDLGTLSNSLERAGFHTETFVPRESAHTTGAQADVRNSQESRRESPEGGTRGSRQEQQQQQRERRRDPRSAKWIEELENLR